MALEIFLRLDGVTGGSRNYYHKGWSDVVSWEWSMSCDAGAVPDAAATRPCMNRICLVKRTGIDSPSVLSLFARGALIPSAEISVVPAVGKREAQQKYLSITLEDVRIESLVTGGSIDESSFNERLGLRFDRVRFEYFHTADATMGGTAAAIEAHAFGWDIARGAEW